VGYDDEKSKGLDYRTMTVLVNVVPQSQEIFDAVHKKKQKDDFGAGD
jgi:S-adenosylmethionine synthetase